MTDEEKWELWRNKNAEIKKPYGGSVHKHIVWYEGVDRRKAFLDGLAEGRKIQISHLLGVEKENAELKKEISVLLSCSNCPDNKGGYICVKEYNDKCLAQKIQYIKELKEENEKMKCYENCKHSYTDSENIVFCYLPFSQEDCKSCKLYNHKNTDNDYWELADD